jgi:hypothetical protein
MRLEGTLDFEQRRVQRWVPVIAIIIPVFLFVATATWFIRAFIAPPMAAIPNLTMVAASGPSAEPPATPAELPQPAASEPSPVLGYAGNAEPPASVTLPMFATFAIAPLETSLRTAPPAAVEPEPHVAALPAQQDEPAPAISGAEPAPEAVASLPKHVAGGAAAAIAEFEQSQPLAGPIPLPPRRRISALPADGQVPIPRGRPEPEASHAAATDAERRSFAAHGAE